MQQIQLAGCVIQDADGRVLLLHRNTDDLRQWEIPGGKLEHGEEASATAERELREELGVEVTLVRELGARSFVEGDRTMLYTWFLARIVSGEPRAVEAHIHDKCGFHRIEDLQRMGDELSPNTRNFLGELVGGTVSL